MSAISGLPVVPDTALPASVRSGSAADKQSYKAALGFEQMLVDQMVQSMAGDSQDSDNPLTSGPYAQQMQSALSTAIESSGGLGLAQQLYGEIK
jgi:Rod binding domain-containing protein